MTTTKKKPAKKNVVTGVLEETPTTDTKKKTAKK